jgi:radical SAM superfamily enzyme YgiQ (UPF0313 family)
MYKDKKFRVRQLDEILKDLDEIKSKYGDLTNNIFLADGNALVLETKSIVTIIEHIKTLFPSSGRIGIYAAPKDILRKPLEDLIKLKNTGLDIAYLGIESGSDAILEEVVKGVTQAEMIEAGQKMKAAGIKLSVMVISGLGGESKWREHALESAKVVNAIQPDYMALLTLLTPKGTPLYESVQKGAFKLLSPKAILRETELMIEHLTLNDCVFRSNHVSNYLSLAGQFPVDKARLLEEVREATRDEQNLRDEWMRQL